MMMMMMIIIIIIIIIQFFGLYLVYEGAESTFR